MRVDECAHIIRAEEVYATLLRHRVDVAHGLQGWLEAKHSSGRSWQFRAAGQPNSVWRRGRVFLV